MSSINRSDVQIAFVRGYRFHGSVDLKEVASRLPQGIALCTPSLIAGEEHAKAVLTQAQEYWNRGLSLARNRSIDLLMRISCRSQIELAIKMSSIESAKKIAMLGIADSTGIEDAEHRLSENGGKRNDSVISLHKGKEKFLRRTQEIPDSINTDQFSSWLAEKSILLSLER